VKAAGTARYVQNCAVWLTWADRNNDD